MATNRGYTCLSRHFFWFNADLSCYFFRCVFSGPEISQRRRLPETGWTIQAYQRYYYIEFIDSQNASL